MREILLISFLKEIEELMKFVKISPEKCLKNQFDDVDL